MVSNVKMVLISRDGGDERFDIETLTKLSQWHLPEKYPSLADVHLLKPSFLNPRFVTSHIPTSNRRQRDIDYEDSTLIVEQVREKEQITLPGLDI